MNADDAKEMTAAAVRREWPEGKAPFPEYWRGFVGWLAFHSSRIGRRVMSGYVEGAVARAKDAERRGAEPEPWVVSEAVRAIWRRAEEERRRRVWADSARLAARAKEASRRRVGGNAPYQSGGGRRGMATNALLAAVSSKPPYRAAM